MKYYLIAGGEPEGIKIEVRLSGCRENKSSMSRITVTGNNNTTPSGIDIDEFPFNRIRRRRNDNRDGRRPLEISSSEGIPSFEGIRRTSWLTNPIAGNR